MESMTPLFGWYGRFSVKTIKSKEEMSNQIKISKSNSKDIQNFYNNLLSKDLRNQSFL